MLGIATIVYLPDHIMTMSRRAYYYCAGDAPLLSKFPLQAAETFYGSATRAGDAVLEAATEWAQTVGLLGAAMNRTAVESAKEVVGQAAEVMGGN